MDNKKFPPLCTWTYFNDGRVERNGIEEPQKEDIKPPDTPTEPPKFDYDKLIAESTGLYRDWWILWKSTHPELALIPEKEPKIIIPPKPKVTLRDLLCKRCGNIWTPRSNIPPIQCPKCKSPYWNKKRRNP